MSLSGLDQNQHESLIAMMQRVLGSNSDDFTEDTILGSDINRIRHLFYNLETEGRTFLVQYGVEIFKARVTDVSAMHARLDIPGMEQEMARRCRIKFEIANILYEFEVPIDEFFEEGCLIRIPAFLQSTARRGDRRLYVDDMFMRFIIIYNPLFGKRGTGQFIEARYPNIVNELKKDEPDLHMINRVLTQELHKISPNYEIVFYTEKTKRGIMESLVEQSQKTLFISNTSNLESYFTSYMPGGMINYHAEYTHMMRYGDEEDAAREFESIRQQDTHNFMTAYTCAPLMIFDEVVGHVFLNSTVFDRLPLDADSAMQVDLLVRLLNYAMSKTVIARSYFRHTYSRIVNISRSGLLFELNNRIIFDYLTFHDRLKMVFNIRHHQLAMRGTISRFFPWADGYNIGVEFFDAGPDDFKVMENFIYTRNLQEFG